VTRLHRPILVAVLAAGLLGAPEAPAALTDDVAEAGAKAGAVTEAATNALPPLPVPVDPPDVPEIPAPAPPPSGSKPPPAPPPPASSVTDVVRGVAGGAGETAKGVAPAQAPSVAEGPGALPDSGDEPDARAVEDRSGRRKTDPMERASPLRWRAYVWPAVALRVEAAVRPLLVGLGDLTDVQAPDLLGLSFSPSALSGSVGIDRPSVRVDPPNLDRQSSSPGFALSDEKLSLLATLLIALLGVVGLVSLARLVIGEELFEPRHWRGHRG
jgi:hypothetical protein